MATYYIDQSGGDDGNDGLSEENAWKTINKVQATLTSDQSDTIVKFKKGELWREQYAIAGYGTSGHPFVHTYYGSGDLPKIYGSEVIGTWEPYNGNQWQATCSFDPTSVFFILTDGSIKWGKEESSIGAVDAEYDWYWASNVLYCYATTDPDSRYNSIEASTRTYGITSAYDKNYITISHLEIGFTADRNIFIWQRHHWIIEHCEVHHFGTKSTGGKANINLTGANCIVRYNKVNNGFMGILIASQSYATDDNIIEHNEVYDIFHAALELGNYGDFVSADGNIFRYNLVYTTDNYDPLDVGNGIFIRSATASQYITNTEIYYNLLYNIEGGALYVMEGCTNVNIYNNTVVGSTDTTDWSLGVIIEDGDGGSDSSGINIKNNIVIDMYTACLSVASGCDTWISSCDYNLWYNSVYSIYAIVVGKANSPYTSGEFATYKSETGWDTNGLWEDPKFVDKDNNDFHLASDSPCRNVGADVGLSEDYEGNTVPYGAYPDIGAFEKQRTRSKFFLIKG